MDIKKIVFFGNSGKFYTLEGDALQDFLDLAHELKPDSLIKTHNGVINMRNIEYVGYVTD
ncbi:hypothetical protein ACFO25_09990 [Paenactinomyces guangxiensis]|uniref:Uncharacterized protein n=1 Tax=Paenactinomyces guangxiensis TaxID=1490290 RepID=A0A7W1WS75_9BACL|nr:hypothetical protein [Paenactinomyces guangxiensis]MBA4495115.1 hypothetical protein [Paenactinomyces guangxiensis]MBH8592201.1 hypothetical protein [Paenactinomyces guangxiensis]